MKLIDIGHAIFIIVMYLALYISNIVAVGLKNIEQDWPTYRCTPGGMAIAGFIGYDSKLNFMQCIQTTQSGYMDYLMQPINYIISMIGMIANKVVKDTGNIRDFVGNLRNKIIKMVQAIFGIFSNIIIAFQRIIISMKDMIKKLVGIFSTLMFIMQGGLYTMQSMWGGIFGQMVRSLGRK
jgi:hypothetical protein